MSDAEQMVYDYEVAVDDPAFGVGETTVVAAKSLLDAARAFAQRSGWGWHARRRSRGSLRWLCAPVWVRAREGWTRVDVRCAVYEWAYIVQAAPAGDEESGDG
jgi:hypothetical protein